MNQTFGTFIRQKRLEAGYSLRKFCEKMNIDQVRWSKIERDRTPIEFGENRLNEIRSVLKIEDDDAKLFYDLIDIADHRIPDHIYSDKEVMDVLPIFFCASNGRKIKKEDLNKLFKILKNR